MAPGRPVARIVGQLPTREQETTMLKAILTAFAAVAAATAFALAGAPHAAAAASPTLDGESLAHVSAADVASKCLAAPFAAKINWEASGAAAGAYAGTFGAAGTAALALGGGASLTGLDGTFTIAAPAGALKGTLQRVDHRTTGTGGCNAAASDGWISASGVVYTVTLPDGTIDQGLVELSLVDDPADGRFSATFRSTSRVADADLDGVGDGSDNCPSSPNADQRDLDADGLEIGRAH